MEKKEERKIIIDDNMGVTLKNITPDMCSAIISELVKEFPEQADEMEFRLKLASIKKIFEEFNQ